MVNPADAVGDFARALLVARHLQDSPQHYANAVLRDEKSALVNRTPSTNDSLP